MIINSGSGDTSTVFALLTAISSPEAAKANLQEIADASAGYQKMVEEFRIESAKTKSELSDLKAQADAQFAAAKDISDKFAASSDKKSKELSDLQTSLDTREAVIRGKEDTLQAREEIVTKRENDVTTRETLVSQRENAAAKLSSDAEALKALYTNKISAMQSIVNQ